MEGKTGVRFTLGKQSSMAPERNRDPEPAELDDGDEIDPGVRLLYAANEGDIGSIRELLDSGVDVNFRDIDNRTALHIAACQGSADVVSILIEYGAQVDPKDRWGSTVRAVSLVSISIV